MVGKPKGNLSPCDGQRVARMVRQPTRSCKLVRMSRTAAALLLLGMLLLSFAAAPSSAEDSASQKAADADSAASLRTMHEIVGRIKLESGEGDERRPLDLLPEPILRYSDAPHGLEDATIWIWRRGERPAVLLKLESYPMHERGAIWSFCLTSAWNSPVFSPFSGGNSWSAKSAEISPQWLPKATSPAKTPELRLRQLRETTRRFTAYRVYGEFGRTELRLLSRPIYRYKSEADGIFDGAVFCITKDLNPHIVLLIEAVDSGHESRWRYAAVRHGDAECHLLLDGQEVWHTERKDSVAPRQPYYWFQWPASDIEHATPVAGD